MVPNHSAVCVWPHSPDYRGSVTGVPACFLEEKKWLFAVQAPQSLKEDEETRRRLTTTWSFNVTEPKKRVYSSGTVGLGLLVLDWRLLWQFERTAYVSVTVKYPLNTRCGWVFKDILVSITLRALEGTEIQIKLVWAAHVTFVLSWSSRCARAACSA